MNRVVNLELWNYSDIEYTFGGEYFESGYWTTSDQKKMVLRRVN